MESVSLSHSPTISASVFENGQDGIDVRKNDTTQVPNRINKNPENNRINNNQSQTLSTKNRVSNNHLFMGLLMGIILVVFGIVLCTMFLLVRSRRKKVSLLHKHTTLIANHNNKGAISIDLDDLKRNLSLTPIMSKYNKFWYGTLLSVTQYNRVVLDTVYLQFFQGHQYDEL